MAARHTAQGWWLEEVGPAPPQPPLEGEVDADVAIVGGGYTGMWTAWFVKQLEPEARVVLVEAGQCGTGPSGRNGGFVNALWFSVPTLRRRFGGPAALELARAAAEAVRSIGAWCEEQRVDAWYRRAGYIQASTAPAQDGAWRKAADACGELGAAEACRTLAEAQVRERCDSPLFRGAAFYPDAGTVQPARLARGLRSRLIDAGVRIFERTRAGAIGPRRGHVAVDAGSGKVRAGSVILASGAAMAGHGPLRRRLTVTSSHMVITEPVPDVLEEIGWTGGECITDSRHLVHYFRTTLDGRIAFGWGGGRVVPGARLDGRAELDPRVAAEVERHLIRFFPQLSGRRVAHAWGGPIDVSPTHVPLVGELGSGRVHFACGYTGNGVGPSHLVGRTLAALALDRRDESTRLAIVEPPQVRVPPEPLRYVGGTIVRAALVRKERLEEESRRPGPVTRFVAGLPERVGIHVGR
jgi:glycine/D-amino acid oxidase-like deaminating enzyme